MTTARISSYVAPPDWIRYDRLAIFDALVEAKTAARLLNQMPNLPQWIEQVHEEQLRLEAVGTSRIEGAAFTPGEQEEALAPAVPDPRALTHSQRQLRAANSTYRWMRVLPADRQVTAELILDIHRRIVTGCDDDHCEPGALRRDEVNVTFGSPLCRGAEGGAEVELAFDELSAAIGQEFRGHDPIIRAMAAHYHVGAMHPFGDGNGRTARALEAFMLRGAGVNSMVMVSLSNYYYEHRDQYFAALQESRARGHDLTPFLRFALPAVAAQCNALIEEITRHTKRVLFREFAQSLFGRLRSPRRRALAARQLNLLNDLLDRGPVDVVTFFHEAREQYSDLKHGDRAFTRDVIGLLELSAIEVTLDAVTVNLDWPQQASESDLLERLERMPSAATAKHPAMPELARLLGRRR